MPVFVFSVYDTVWKAAVSFFLRPESVTIKLGLRGAVWPPNRWGAGLHPWGQAWDGILTHLWEANSLFRNQFPRQDRWIFTDPGSKGRLFSIAQVALPGIAPSLLAPTGPCLPGSCCLFQTGLPDAPLSEPSPEVQFITWSISEPTLPVLNRRGVRVAVPIMARMNPPEAKTSLGTHRCPHPPSPLLAPGGACSREWYCTFPVGLRF